MTWLKVITGAQGTGCDLDQRECQEIVEYFRLAQNPERSIERLVQCQQALDKQSTELARSRIELNALLHADPDGWRKQLDELRRTSETTEVVFATLISAIQGAIAADEHAGADLETFAPSPLLRERLADALGRAAAALHPG